MVTLSTSWRNHPQRLTAVWESQVTLPLSSMSLSLQVAQVLKNLTRIITTLSISSHYYLLKKSSSAAAVTSTDSPRINLPNDESLLLRPRDAPCGTNTSIQSLARPNSLESSHSTATSSSISSFSLSRLSKELFSRAVSSATTIPPGDHEFKHVFPPPPSSSPRTPPPPPSGPRHNVNSPQPRFTKDDEIHRMIANPALYNPLRAPRYPIVLCHGLYGFDVRGPSTFPVLQKHYWSNILAILRDKVGADVIVTAVPGTGSVAARAEKLDKILEKKALGRGVNLLAHSMGGLDCRHLITHVRPTAYTPLSLTTVCTPHQGSPFMDWCASNIGLGKVRQEAIKSAEAQPSDLTSLSSSEERAAAANGIPERDQPAGTNPSVVSAQSSSSSPTSSASFSLNLSSLPSSFTTLLLSLVDTPAYHNLTTSFLKDHFNPSTPNMPNVKYYSIASRVGGVSIWHPFWLPKIVLDGAEEKERKKWREEGRHGWDNESLWGNDGLVTIQSARWGEFLGVMEGCDHWEMRGARGLDINLNLPRLDVDLGLQNLGLGNGEWSLKDWTKFVRVWRNEEKREQERREQDFAASVATFTSQPSSSSSPPSETETAAAQEQAERAHAEAMLKASTDKLSAVFDWLVEQVPSPSRVASQGVINAIKEDEAMARRKSDTPINELATKEDLERMYVALARKLYDDGL